MKMMLMTAALLVGMASPVFAQTSQADWAPQYTNAWQARHGSRAMSRSGESAYAMVPSHSINPNSPALTGGGSLGYNEAVDHW